MKRIALAFVLVTLVTALISQHTTNALESGPSANGSFQFSLVDGNTRFIEFNARIHGNTAKGSMTFNDPAAVIEGGDCHCRVRHR